MSYIDFIPFLKFITKNISTNYNRAKENGRNICSMSIDLFTLKFRELYRIFTIDNTDSRDESSLYQRGCHGHYLMVVGFTTICAINAYHH